MHITDLFESKNPLTLVIYPGRFQPWHRGHRKVYEYLTGIYGRDMVYIATSNKVDPPRSPFNFSEKVQFMHFTGIPNDRIVEARDPYKALEIVQNFDPETTRLIFAVSEKDMEEDPRFKFGYKKDGSPTYFQPLPNDPSNMLSFKDHAYIMKVPVFEFKVNGKLMRSATELRRDFAAADDETQKRIILDLFGNYNRDIHALMKSKISGGISEGKVLKGNFGRSGKYYHHPDIGIPSYDPVSKKNVPPGHEKGREEKYRDFKVVPVTSRIAHMVGITNSGDRVVVGTTTVDAAHALVAAYNRGGFTDQRIEKINLGDQFEDAAGVGVIAGKNQKNDPRYKMSLTKDVGPNTMRKNMKALRLI